MTLARPDHPAECYLDGKPAFWNGKPARCRRVKVVVGDSGRFPSYWARVEGLVGEEVFAIEISGADQVGADPFYILDSEGEGTTKVIRGGTPFQGHRSLDIDKVIGDDA